MLFSIQMASIGSCRRALEDAGMADRTKWHFTFLTGKPEAKVSLGGTEYAPDRYFVGDGVVYVYCPNGYGRTKISYNFFERKLKVRATTRNWNTTNKLRELTIR